MIMQLKFLYTRLLVPTSSPSVRLMSPPLLWVLSMVFSSWWQWWDVMVNHQHLESFTVRNTFVLIVSSSSVQDHLGIHSVCQHPFTLLFCIHWPAVPYYIQIYFIFCLVGDRCYFFFFFLFTPKTSSVQLHVCISSAAHG